MNHVCVYCDHLIHSDRYTIVSLGQDNVYFHNVCHRHWLKEREDERKRRQDIEEFFG